MKTGRTLRGLACKKTCNGLSSFSVAAARKVLKTLERARGIEPLTFSLGS